MARGITPRQPAKTGRHEGTRRIQRTTRLKPVSKGRGGQAGAPVTTRAVSKQKSAKGYNPLAPSRVTKILKRLDQNYADVTCALHHNSAWELVVATILSAQCTDVRVNIVTPELFNKYPTVQDFARLRPEQVEPDIRTTGFFRNKAKSLVGAAKKIVEDFGGKVPDEMDQLLTLPGVARKTANVVLGSWFKKNIGVVVDTHVTRISNRLELSTGTDARKIEQDLMKVIPQKKWTLFSHQIIWHGRKICIARKPKCAECPLFVMLGTRPGAQWRCTKTHSCSSLRR
jgi:endonuclease-3